jgi:aspartate aminotransferase-like enzyme
VLVCIHGQFGERFAAIATALGAQVDQLHVEWGKAIDPAAVEERVRSADYRAVLVIHNESSTAVVTDLAAIGRIVRDTPALLIVDSVSGLGGLEMRQEEWGVDMVVSSSQKALMCPPGVGIVSVSAKGWRAVNREGGMPRFYWDFRKALSSIEKSETPFTTPVSLIAGLLAALEMIHSEGLPAVLERHRRLSTALRAGCEMLGLRTFGETGALSSTVVALEVPAPLNGGDIVRYMYERYQTAIGGSRNKLSGRIIRIGTMGHVHENDVLTDLFYLEQTLDHLGFQVRAGAGMSAAAASERGETANAR